MSFFCTFSNINISTPASWHCCNSPAGWKRWKVSERFRKVEILIDSEKGYKGYNITCFLFLDWWVCQKPMIGHLPPYALYKPILSRYMVVQILGCSSNITHIFHLKWVFNLFSSNFPSFPCLFRKDRCHAVETCRLVLLWPADAHNGSEPTGGSDKDLDRTLTHNMSHRGYMISVTHLNLTYVNPSLQ